MLSMYDITGNTLLTYPPDKRSTLAYNDSHSLQVVFIMWLEHLKTLPQHFLPHHTMSRCAGIIANCRQILIKNWIINRFIRRYGVDLACAIESDPRGYSNFNSFFTRLLKPDARPITQDHQTIISPVDGTISQVGAIKEEGRIFQAKGFHFDLKHLLGGCEQRASIFQGGSFVTFYLAPKDYHRVHIPIDAELREMLHIPGRLFSVNPRTSRTVGSLFARNERVVNIFETSAGPMAVILVGAMLVASISTAWHGDISSPRKKQVRVWQYPDTDGQSVVIKRGNEVGHFKLGSTVIVLFGANMMEWSEDVKPNISVQVGQVLGKLQQ